jgi:hypothetical protein
MGAVVIGDEWWGAGVFSDGGRHPDREKFGRKNACIFILLPHSYLIRISGYSIDGYRQDFYRA